MSTHDAQAAAADARERLAQTLDEIEDRVNIPRKIGEATKRAQVAYEDNPLPFVIGAAVAGVTALGLVAWGVLGRKG